MDKLGIQCPYCHCYDSTMVVRTVDDISAKKRYRRCVKCGKTFPTVEAVQPETVEKIERKKSEPPSQRELKNAVDRMKKLTEKV